ncbi:MAG: hypothetical protein WC547_02985 [Candidatus Omnitrophota bacterium]
MAPQLRKRFNDKRIGELLMERGIIGFDHLENALRIQRDQTSGEAVSSGDILTQLGYAREEEIIEAFLMQYSVPYLPLNNYIVNQNAIAAIPHSVARRLMVMPLDIMGRNLTIAISNPLKHKGLDELNSITGLHIQPCIATSLDIAKAIELYYGVIESPNWEGNYVAGN